MKKYTPKQLTMALALIYCLPVALVGCANQPSAPSKVSSTPIVNQARVTLDDDVVGKPQPVAKPPMDVEKQDSSAGSSKKAEADNGLKIIPGSGVFVKPANVSVPPPGAQDIVLNFEGADLREVVRVVMGDMLNENYTIDPKINGTVTIHTSQPINRAAVMPILETVLRMNGAAMVKDAGGYKIGPINSALRGATTPQLGALQPGYSVQVVQLQFIAAREMSKILEPLLPEGSILRVDEARNLVMLAGAESEMRHALETVSVFDMDWLAGMSVGLFTLKSVDVKSIMPELELLFGDKSKSPFAGMLRLIPIERMNAVFVVSPRPQYLEQAKVWVERLDRNGGKSGTRLYVYPVQNGNAEKIAALLSQVIGGKNASTTTPAASVAPGLTATTLQSSGASTSPLSGSLGSSTGANTGAGASLPASTTTNTQSVVASGTGEALGLGAGSNIKVIADKDNNALLILANGAEYEKIEEAVKKLDVVPRQVLVEVTIAEVTLAGALSYGLEWFFNSNNNLSGMLFNSNSTTRALPSDPTGTVTPKMPFSAVWRTSGGNISAVLSALASNTKLNVISSPHIMVTDNQVAKINVGSSVPVQGQSTYTGSATTPVVTSVVYVDTGVVLSVRPHINSGGLVTLEVSQEVSDVQEGVTTPTLNSPTINKRSAQTTVAVQSGDTMVLAGLIKDDKNAGSSGMPLLSDIPIVGALFGAKSDTSTRRELIITITPRVVNDTTQAREVTAEFRKKLTGMRKLNGDASLGDRGEARAAATEEGAKGN